MVLEMIGTKFKEFIDGLAPIAKEMGKYKTRILYGFRYDEGGGPFLRYYLKKYYDMEFDYIIDETVYSYLGDVYKLNLLDYLDTKDCLVVATNSKEEGLNDIWTVGGVIDANKVTGLSNIGYVSFIEKEYDIDLINREYSGKIADVCNEGNEYASSRDTGIPDLLEFICSNYEPHNINAIDIGCGKGTMIIAFNDFGIRADGIEIVNSLHKTASINVNKVGLSANIFNISASEFNKYSKYNLYYLYNPFHGREFRNTLKRIEGSQKKSKGVLVYADPYLHNTVVEDGVFKLVHQLKGDWGSRMVNIYES